jgi:hypothetical protein
MKKIFACLISSMSCMLLITCEKQYPATGNSSLIRDARQYFSENVINSGPPNPYNYRAGIAKTVRWEQATIIALSIGKAVIIPVNYQTQMYVRSSFDGNHYFNLNNLTELLIYRDSMQSYHAQLITTLPDSSFLVNPAGPFFGFRFVEDWQGNTIAKYLYAGNKPIRKYTAPGIETDVIITNCSTIDGYNYSPGSGADPVEWSESGGCTDSYFPDGSALPNGADYASFNPGGGGGGGTGSTTTINPAQMIIYSGNDPITNVAQYIGCFTNNGGTSGYMITLYVDQPVPGSRTPYTFGSGSQNGIFNVGHVFLVFQQNGSTGAIIRTMGFYPKSWVTPVNPTDPGSLNNDQDHIFDISLSMTISGQQFMEILNTFALGNTVNYNLNTNNCTSWAINALSAGGINIQTNTGVWPLGSGDDPGDLGEDIRSMTLAPNMSRNTNSGNSPLNSGTCQ